MQNNIKSIEISGNLNPMYGKRHSVETKQKISQTQKERYQAIRKAISEDLLKQGQTDTQTRKEVLLHLLDKNELNFTSVQQAINFLAIMLNEQRIKEVVSAEIKRFLENETTRLINLE